MQKTQEIMKGLSEWQTKIFNLEAEIAPLRQDVERAEEQVRTRSEALSIAQEVFTKAQGAYRAECRKLASNERSNAVECKRALDEAEAKIEGLKQLLEDDQLAVTTAWSALEKPEAKLASAQQQEAVASGTLKIAAAMERVSENVGSLSREVNAAIQEIDTQRGIPGVGSHAVDIQRSHLHSLGEHLREAGLHFPQ